MGERRKRQSAGLAVVMLGLAVAGPGARAQQPEAPPPLHRPSDPAPDQAAGSAGVPAEDEAAKLDRLFADLAEPGREDWQRIEAEISRIWSHSGSDAMDLLLRRGNDAMEAEQYDVAVEHFSALIDHAPDFAEAWNGRATAFYLLGEYSLSIADIEHVLTLNPRHFGALSGLAGMLEELGQPELALKAMKAAREINPNRPNIDEAITRLERMTGAAEL